MLENLCDDDFLAAGDLYQFVRQYAVNCLLPYALELTNQEIDQLIATVRASLGVQGYRHYAERRIDGRHRFIAHRRMLDSLRDTHG